ncbi:MAG: HDOD domain-containing protein [Burkholderiaceae bacterium]
MNAPDLQALLDPAAPRALSSLSICYSPLIDRGRKAMGTRLTMLSLRPQDRPRLGDMLTELNEIWPEASAPVLVAPLDAVFDASLLEWKSPHNALLEVPCAALSDPATQQLLQQARRAGLRMVLRGRSEVPLPPALVECFEYSLIHIADDRRVTSSGQMLPVPTGITRRVPYIISGVQTVADVDACYERGAAASVGWPLEDITQVQPRALQPGQAVVLRLLRLVRDDADINDIDAALKQDPALAFKLLRLVNSAAFGLSVQITSFQHAVMMLGYKKMMRWLSLLMTTASKDANTAPLVHASIRRGLFLEYVAGDDADNETRDELFITGAFSLLDRITGATFPQLFELIALSDNVTDAICEHEGPHGPYLGLIEAIERGDPIAIRRATEALALPVSDCNRALLRALAAAQSLDGEI